jgi:hypothetical protein
MTTPLVSHAATDQGEVNVAVLKLGDLPAT